MQIFIRQRLKVVAKSDGKVQDMDSLLPFVKSRYMMPNISERRRILSTKTDLLESLSKISNDFSSYTPLMFCHNR